MDVEQVILDLLGGFGISVGIFFSTLVLSLPLGLALAFCQRSRFSAIRWITDVFIWIIRGTPLMLQIVFIYYVPGLLKWEVKISNQFIAVVVAFVINYSCYFSVIFKGGMNSVAKGQYEACQVLGMSKTQAFKKVALPQIYKNILPPMSNEIITLIKDTSLANIISVGELVMVSKELLNAGYLWPFFSTAIFYLVFVGLLSIIFKQLEKRTNRYR